MSEIKLRDRITDRYNILIVLFIIFLFVIVYRLWNLQVVHGIEYNAQAELNLNERTIIAPRGNIIDSNGVPIATNRMGYLVQIARSGLEPDELNAVICKLIKILEKHNDSINKSLTKYLSNKPIDYGPLIKNYKDPLKSLKINLGIDTYSNAQKQKTAKDVYYYLRDTVYEINMDKNTEKYKKIYSDSMAYKIMCVRFEIRNFSTLNPQTIATDVSKEAIAEIEENHRDFPGVSTDYVPIRKYVNADIIGHVIGYMNQINSDQYNMLKSKGYGMNDLIGITGIEASAEKYLKGVNGKKSLELDSEGRLFDEISSSPAKPGDDVQLTLNMRLQKVAFDSLKKQIKLIHDRKGNTAVKGNFGDAVAGSVIALDVRNGNVLAMASYPSFDPSVFLEGADNKQAQKTIAKLLSDGIKRPMENRTISEPYAPGSTFKPLMSIAGLQTGKITKDSLIDDPGIWHVPNTNTSVKCLEYNPVTHSAHGWIKLQKALATSCNIYFQRLGVERLGISTIDKWAKMFGLGEKTGIALPGEQKGMRSNPENLKKYQPGQLWSNAYTAYSSIGQGLSLFTPIQLCRYISAIANGGRLYTPHIIKKAVKYDGTIDYEAKPEYKKLPVSQADLNAVIDGMVAVAYSSEGTAADVFGNFPEKVAGKTGTAETPEKTKSNNGVFVCFAPAYHPKIAVAIVIEHGVWGKLAAPVAKDIMMEYFNLNNKAKNNDKATPDRVVITQ